ncbi:MAG: hypothetical protein A2015_14190 [Spirochaetes bacterium GWF1_31_7]|nr:MAG: hypothetical protein A2Y30_03560 [Spirochaetes bacterium GWE1_32_154]OHD45256.1 MAG: hypothetical protein A2Y29_02385 [Spirochaetes bacterium GWE2_31_10]OHD50551.1 MAG: hypothetical protein A2015_14190 [Spirochaetes bacterium GWF1_31_7]OHD78571.1 MAG: hypothetical protein A2355_03170 [Spirochaetes bacterium RIFOXYB1_FULL_32_8]HBD94202.1 hypothetical protein [Spirochaetia bacterium]
MSDEKSDNLDMEQSDDGGVSSGSKKGSFLNPFIIKVLSGVAAIIGIVVLVVIVSLLTIRCSSGGTGGAGRPDDGIVDIRRQKVTHPETLPLDKPFRQQLKDGKMIQLDIALGFKPKNKKLQAELTQNIPQIRDIIIKTLSRLDSDYFKDEDSLDKLQEDLLKQLNRMLNDGEVERIFFKEYTLMGN